MRGLRKPQVTRTRPAFGGEFHRESSRGDAINGGPLPGCSTVAIDADRILDI